MSGEANALLFQATIVVMGVATFAYGFAAFHYYGVSMADRFSDAERLTYARRADRLWLVGTTLLLLGPSLVLFTIGLYVAGAAWLALWFAFVVFVGLYFPRVRTPKAE